MYRDKVVFYMVQFNSRNRALSYEQRIRYMESALLNNEPVSFLPFFKQSVVYGLHNRIMQALDDGENFFRIMNICNLNLQWHVGLIIL